MDQEKYEWEIKEGSRIEVKVLPLDEVVVQNYVGMTKPKIIGNTHEATITNKYYFKFKDAYKLIHSTAKVGLKTNAKILWTAQDPTSLHILGHVLKLIENKITECGLKDEDLANRIKTLSNKDIEKQAFDLLNSRFELEN